MGRAVVAIIDPGPDVDEHVRALASAVSGAEEPCVVLTHGHVDHAECAARLAEALGCDVLGPARLDVVDTPLEDGDAVETDEGRLVAVHTPGHTRDHLGYHWEARRALFAGDLMLGAGDTTWVGEYPGCVADYLSSLERVRKLDPDVIYPAHGPPITDPRIALDRFERHRLHRIGQVARAMAEHPDADVHELLEAVYGDTLPERVRRAATLSLGALMEHVRGDAAG